MAPCTGSNSACSSRPMPRELACHVASDSKTAPNSLVHGYERCAACERYRPSGTPSSTRPPFVLRACATPLSRRQQSSPLGSACFWSCPKDSRPLRPPRSPTLVWPASEGCVCQAKAHSTVTARRLQQVLHSFPAISPTYCRLALTKPAAHAKIAA